MLKSEEELLNFVKLNLQPWIPCLAILDMSEESADVKIRVYEDEEWFPVHKDLPGILWPRFCGIEKE